jgi:pimeloyl-ACP methyl ester carboxylesterase
MRQSGLSRHPKNEWKDMRFVLVHGGFHGAWCWELLIPELEKRGHAAVAFDLPGHGKRAQEIPDLAAYRDAVVEVLQPGDVLVGHSLGGFITSAAADAAIDRVGHIMYLASGLPIEGQTMIAAGAGDLAQSATAVEAVDDGQRFRFRSDEAATAFFFHDCSTDIANWACSMMTPQPLGPLMEPISIPRFWAAELPRSLILCRQDHAMTDREASHKRQIERLGVEPLWIDTAHSPFLSEPAACADLMVEAAQRPPIGPLWPE